MQVLSVRGAQKSVSGSSCVVQTHGGDGLDGHRVSRTHDPEICFTSCARPKLGLRAGPATPHRNRAYGHETSPQRDCCSCLMRGAIHLKLKLNEPSPAEAAASRRAEEEVAAAKVATAAAAKPAKAEGQDPNERLPKHPKPKPPVGPPPQAEEEWIMHVDTQSDRPFLENVASGVVVWQNPLRAKPPAPAPPAVVGPGGTPASALSVANAGFDANPLGGGSGSGGASYRTGCNTGLSPVLGAVGRSGGNINVTIAQRGAYEGAQISHYHYGAEAVGGASGGAHGRQQLGVGGQQQQMSLPLQQHGHQQHGHPQHHVQQHQQHRPPPSHPPPFY